MNLLRSGRDAAGPPALLASSAERPAQVLPDHLRAGPRILACTRESRLGGAVVKHALAVGEALGLPVSVARVLETPRHVEAPVDPLEWQLRRKECRHALDRIATDGGGGSGLESVLLAGPTADELARWAKENDATLLVLATHEHRRHGHGLGSTAHRLLEAGSASLLLVPPENSEAPPAYRRIFVPLDGSPRSESILPVATRIARAHGAEIVLVHVVPRAEIVDDSVIEGPARELSARLEAHNERRARAYLEDLRGRLWRERLPARSIVASHGEPRALLRRLAVEQHADLVVASSHGRSGMNDVPCGSVTEYLATHAPAPMMIVRPGFACGPMAPAGQAAAEPQGPAFPLPAF